MKRLQTFVLLSFVTFAFWGGLSVAQAVTDRVVVSSLSQPWAVVAGPDGNIWISEKKGTIKIFSTSFQLISTLTSFPDLAVYGEGGLLDLAFHPDFGTNGWIFVNYSVADSVGYHTRVNRFTYRGGELREHKIIFDGPSSNATSHFGSRLLFDGKGYLFVSFGERRLWDKAQDINQMHGKIVRLHPDGSIPRDNPFGVSSPVYSTGHRNPQGLAINPATGRIYDSEHGPTGYEGAGQGGDEINEIIAGENYGWPLYHHRQTAPGFRAPLLEYSPAVAPSGIAFYTGSKIPAWKGDLFVATLAGQRLLRLRIARNGTATEEEILLKAKYGRLRDVETSPDGTLLVVSESGKLIQLK